MPAAPLNVILVCFDTLRRDAVATDLCRTPHLDAFAQDAVVYTNAWAEGLPTIPFRRALYTGMRSYPWREFVDDRGSQPNIPGWHAIPASQTTLAERLYARGYLTGLVSDLWHQFKPTMNFHRGFVSWEYIRGQEGDTQRVGAASLATSTPGERRAGPPGYLYQTRERNRDDDYFVARVLDTAADWVEANRANVPYFLCVESFTPHEFWDPPVRFADAYQPRHGAVDHIVPQTLNTKGPDSAADPRDIARTRALYQGYVTFADERFGRFLARLEAAGTLSDTVVAVLSDHGTELWDHGRFGKSEARLHAFNTQINLMIRHPEIRGAHTVEAFVQNQDVAPTLLRLLGIPHAGLDGQDIWPWTRTAPGPTTVITGWGPWAAVRDARWNLLVHTQDLSVAPQLFDLQADPGELHNVAGRHADTVLRLLPELEAVLGGPLPARFVHRPAAGFAATLAGLRQLRQQRIGPGERWSGSNLV